MYLATVNGMPNDIASKMTKQMKDFMWDGIPRASTKWETIIEDKKNGGMGIPDIDARRDA